MNKLISRNPVQRFKEGQKIQKFQNAGIISYKGRDGIDYEAFSGSGNWYYRKKGTQDAYNMPKNYVTTTGIRFYDANGNMIKNPSSNQNNGSSPRDYSFMTKGRLSSESAADKKQRESYFNSQKEKLGFTSPQFDTLGNDQTKRLIEAMGEPAITKSSDKTSFKSAFDKARQSGLQEFVWNGGRYNTQNKGEENFIFQNGKWVAPQPAVETPVVPQTYNRAQVREFLRNKGINPYNFTGDQRRAVRMVLNGQGTDEDKALVQSMGIFKQGGQLPSRNIIERFKKGRKVQTNKRVNDLGNKVIETTISNNSNNPFKTPEEIIQEVTYNKYPVGNDTVYTYIPSHYFFTNPEIQQSNNWPTAGVSLRRPEFEKLREIFKKNFRLVAQ